MRDARVIWVTHIADILIIFLNPPNSTKQSSPGAVTIACIDRAPGDWILPYVVLNGCLIRVYFRVVRSKQKTLDMFCVYHEVNSKTADDIAAFNTGCPIIEFPPCQGSNGSSNVPFPEGDAIGNFRRTNSNCNYQILSKVGFEKPETKYTLK